METQRNLMKPSKTKQVPIDTKQETIKNLIKMSKITHSHPEKSRKNPNETWWKTYWNQANRPNNPASAMAMPVGSGRRHFVWQCVCVVLLNQ